MACAQEYKIYYCARKTVIRIYCVCSIYFEKFTTTTSTISIMTFCAVIACIQSLITSRDHHKSRFE